MEIEYFMSSLASDVMGILTENFLWMRTLGSTPILENEVITRGMSILVLPLRSLLKNLTHDKARPDCNEIPFVPADKVVMLYRFVRFVHVARLSLVAEDLLVSTRVPCPRMLAVEF